jgi:parallel beta-helix repeat protein
MSIVTTEPSTYTITDTGTYTTTDGKDSFYYKAGQVIPMALAIRMDLPGAGYDSVSPFNDIEEERLQDIETEAESSVLVAATGASDQTVINAAFVDSLSVTLRDETYVLSGAIVIPSNGSLIMSPGTILSRTGTGNAVEAVGTSPSHKSNIRISGGKITGTSVVGTQVAGNGIYIDFCDGASIIDVEVSAFGANGDDGAVTVRRSTEIEVARCNLHHSKNGIVTGTSTSTAFPEASICSFHHNKCHDNYDDGIHFQQSARNRITDNACYSNGADASSVGSGIDTLGDDGDLIANNFCYSNVGMGIEIGNTTSTGSADQRITITGNVCASNGTRGIGFLAWSERCTVTGNSCYLNTEDGISFAGTATHESSYHTVTGNVCNANTRHGIYVVNTSNFIHVAHNICRSNSSRGIYVVSAGAGNPTSNELMGNQAIGNTTSQITLGAGATSTILRNNTGYVDRAGGVVSIADGGTITHTVAATPTKYGVTATTSGEFASVTAVSSTLLTVAIKKHDNTAGTTQNIAWWAEV